MNDSPYKPSSLSVNLVSHKETKKYGVELRFPIELNYLVLSREETLRLVQRLLEYIVTGDVNRVDWEDSQPSPGSPVHNSV